MLIAPIQEICKFQNAGATLFSGLGISVITHGELAKVAFPYEEFSENTMLAYAIAQSPAHPLT